MKKLLLLFVLAGFAAFAQTAHSVTLTWLDPANPAGTTYSVYRGTGLCSSTPTFVSVASAIPVLTYIDTTVTVGYYCYQATATLNAIESAPSNTADAKVKPIPPGQLQVQIK